MLIGIDFRTLFQFFEPFNKKVLVGFRTGLEYTKGEGFADHMSFLWFCSFFCATVLYIGYG